MKKIIALSTCSLILISTAPAAGDAVNLSSYFPAPYGAYDRVQLVPQPDDGGGLPRYGCTTPAYGASCCDKEGGLIYYGVYSDPGDINYDPQANKIYVCTSNDADGEWVPLTGSGGIVWKEESNVLYPRDLTNPAAIKVGIGTDTPAPSNEATLHIANGNLRLGGGDTSTILELDTNATSSFRWVTDTTSPEDKLRLETDTSGSFANVLTVDGTNRRVGIGTASPQAALHVNGPASPVAGVPEAYVHSIEGLMTIEKIPDPGVDDSVTFEMVPGSPLGSNVDPNIVYKTTARDASLHISAHDNTTQAKYHNFMTLKQPEMNVGIGDIDAPGSRLTVRGSGNTAATAALKVTNNSEDTLLFVNNAGRVGLRTETPEAPLHIYSLDGTIYMEATSGTPAAELRPASGNTNFIFEATAARMHIFPVDKATGVSTPGLYIHGGSQISIKNDALPANSYTSLDVVGNIQFSGCIKRSGVLLTGTCTSDARLKKNITPLTGALQKILQLEPVTYEFIDQQYGEGPQTGLIAQDAEKVFPDWVSRGEDGYQRVHYGLQIQMHLLEAIQELNTAFDSEFSESPSAE